jgi:3-oxoadipate enol-lactonase
MDAQLTLPDGARLAYEVSGKGSSAAVYGHGMLLSRQAETDMDLFTWDAVQQLADRQLIRYDARGHGGSTGHPEPTEFTFPRFADDLLALLDHLDVEGPVTGMGSSLGCATVLTAAVRVPERFDRLVLLIPPTAWETRAAQTGFYQGLADMTDEGGFDAFATALAGAPTPSSLTDAPGYPPPSLGVVRPLLPSLLRGVSASDLPSREEIARLPHPTLILAWADDPGHPLSTAEQLVDLMPGARLHVSYDAADIRGWGERIATFLTE